MSDRALRIFWVYMTCSVPLGVIYVGSPLDEADVAANREKLMKRWHRDWKIRLIEKSNPTWVDLFPEAVRPGGFEY
jgi:predicted GIY-YIG superfamily endonuclease